MEDCVEANYYIKAFWKNKESCEQNGSNVCPSVGDTAKSAEQYWHSRRGQNIFPIATMYLVYIIVTNICYSLSLRHQLRQCYLSLNSDSIEELEVGPGTFKYNKYYTCLITLFL